MTPIRVQLSRKKGWRMPPNTVKVDRSTPFGNPYNVSAGQSAAECVAMFRHYMSLSLCGHRVEAARRQLRGKNLACWCKPGSPCHADVLLEIANQPEGSAK